MPLMIDELSFESLQVDFVQCVCKRFCFVWMLLNPIPSSSWKVMNLFIPCLFMILSPYLKVQILVPPCHRWPNSRRLQSQQSRLAKWLLLGFQGDSWQIQHFFLLAWFELHSSMRVHGTKGWQLDTVYWIYLWKGLCWRLCTKEGYPSKCADEIHRPQRRWQAKASRTGLHGPAVSFCRLGLFDAKDHWSMKRSSCQHWKEMPAYVSLRTR